MTGLVLLASYPKSGNTWLRVFLTNYWHNGDKPVDINNLITKMIASARQVFDETVGIEASDLTLAEINRLRPLVYEKLAAESAPPLFVKVHDAFTRNDEGKPILSKQAVQKAVYLIRNPLDIVSSYAHHNGATIDNTVTELCNPKHMMYAGKGTLFKQLTQHLGTWSDHVLSWVDEPELPLLVIRYEDMRQSPLDTFTGIVRFLNLEEDQGRIEKALEFSRLERLQEQEKEYGFRERSLATAGSFFRKGKVGEWREVLTPVQIAQLIETHHDVMQRFGYLDQDGNIA